MTYSFDLISRPWIPCIRADGTAVELGLFETLAQAHELREIHAPSPLEVAAIHRLLFAVLHRVFGPQSASVWVALWQEGRWDGSPIQNYFADWRCRFDLFDEKYPFFQAADYRVRQKSVLSMVFHLASGNNATLFDHHTDDGGVILTEPQAARALLVAQTFGLAGPCNPKTKLYFTDSPWARGVVFLMTGSNLFETLALNLLRYTEETPIISFSDDRPAWEMADPFDPRRDMPLGYLDYLTWQSRRMLLFPEQDSRGNITVRIMTDAPGLTLDSDLVRDGTLADPMKHYRIDEKKGYIVLRFNENKALWRDSSALFQLDNSGSCRQPLSTRWLAQLIGNEHLNEDVRYFLAGLGMASDQKRVDFYRHERMPLPLVYLDSQKNEHLLNQLGEGLKNAEVARNKLWGALRRMAVLVISPSADDEGGRRPDRKDIDNLTAHWGVERLYWSDLEPHFHTLLENIPHDHITALTRWQQVLQRAARGAFDHAEKFAGDDPAALKAAVRGREQLETGLRSVLTLLYERKSDR